MASSPVRNLGNCKLNEMITSLMEIFTDICPVYLREKCKEFYLDSIINDNTEYLISYLLDTDYPKRQIVPQEPKVLLNLEEQFEFIKQILPEADPDYLYRKCNELIDNEDQLKLFIDEAIAIPTYPKKTEYLRRQKVSAQVKQYTTEFNVEEFLKLIPNPVEYFENISDQHQTQTNSINSSKRIEYENYKERLLLNIFRDLTTSYIRHAFYMYKSLTKTYKALLLPGFDAKRLKTPRRLTQMPDLPEDNILLLQEIAYINNYQEILEYLEQQEQINKQSRLEAKASGLMLTCKCCCDDEIMPCDIVECESKCQFCKKCLQKYVEITFASGKLEFLCLTDCSSNFSLLMIQQAVSPKLFSKIAYQIQISEIKSANIENIEMCPFCEFATIPPTEDKIFRCLNSDCMKETCRLCQEPSHIPLRCDEVEKDENIKVRTYIENKMTEALVRTCWKCKTKFIKTDGCNKMTCACGAIMCYLCRKPVLDYKHFNGQGGTNFNLCPLFNDLNELHKTNVIQGAQIAKKEVAANIEAGQLLSDPTSNIDYYYKATVKNPNRLS